MYAFTVSIIYPGKEKQRRVYYSPGINRAEARDLLRSRLKVTLSEITKQWEIIT